MKNKYTIALLLLGLGATIAQAQEATTSTAGNALGSGGSASYSVGQVGYSTYTDIGGSASAGAQQAYEIQTLLGIDNLNISLELAVYPNPTVNLLNLQVKDFNSESMQY